MHKGVWGFSILLNTFLTAVMFNISPLHETTSTYVYSLFVRLWFLRYIYFVIVGSSSLLILVPWENAVLCDCGISLVS